MKLNEEYISAIKFAKSHYENFPVISFFLPEEIVPHIAIIYKFARIADDIADSNEFVVSEKLNLLDEFQTELVKSLYGNFTDEFWETLQHTITTYKLTAKYFFDLINAFKMDVMFSKFHTFDEILNYCKHSANPVGRLVLELFDVRLEKAMRFSDKITTALQLTNFYQDVSEDLKNGRLYFPLDELQKFNVREGELLDLKISDNFKNLMKYSVERTEKMFVEGKPLLNYLPPELKFQIKLTIAGGLEILGKIKKLNYNTLEVRPTLTKLDVVKLFVKSLFFFR